MPGRARKPNEFAQQTMPLVLLCAGMIATNNYLAFIDDEARTLDAAAQPARTLFALAFSGSGPHQTPVLYGVLLHVWLRLTGWNFEYLRTPAIVCFLVGLFLLGRAARQFGGSPSASAAIWLSILWPFGFHYGRLEAPYSFVFFLVAGLTLTYLKFLEANTLGTGAALFLFGAALVWTDFFGWAILACLVVDQLLRHVRAKRTGERTIPVRVMLRTVVLWIAAGVPLLRPSYRGFFAASNFHQSLRTILIDVAFHLYTLFVSESVALWHWQLSLPAGIAVFVCIVLIFMKGAGPSRRFLAYGMILLVLMALTGTLSSGRLFLVAPWVLLPVAVAIGSIESTWARPTLAVALLIVGVVGWSGIYARRYYAAPQFLEPWLQQAGDAADKIRTGATVISNSGPFFLYLTYALRTPGDMTEPKLEGLLPDSIEQSDVKSPEQWLAAGHPIAPVMIWVHGVSDPQSEERMQNAAHMLDSTCGSRESHLMMRDAGYDWKVRFLPQIAGPQWRIEVRQYDCASSNSKEMFQIPAR